MTNTTASEHILRDRQARAWNIARLAAALLKEQYHATRVVVFGSLVNAEKFHTWSDIDLAAWGLAPDAYFEAVARVLDLGAGIEIDLIMAERCKPALRSAIDAGVDL